MSERLPGSNISDDAVHHFTDGHSVEDLAKRYPGSAESHEMMHRKIGYIIDRLERELVEVHRMVVELLNRYPRGD
jgi:hypothetical protein